MRGSIVKRSKTSWALVVDIGRDQHGRRRQRWHRFDVDPTKTAKENRQLAQQKLTELLHLRNTNRYVDASKVTLAQYLKEWHSKITPLRDPETARVYGSMITHVAAAPIGAKLLQKIASLDLENFYATVKPRKGKKATLAAGTIQLLHAVINEALGKAVKDKLLASNPATNATERPRTAEHAAQDAARGNCLTEEEVRRVLAAAKEVGAQVEAFFWLAIDSGARKSELLGLTWDHVDLDGGTITIARQLKPQATLQADSKPTKTRRIRKVVLTAETIARLRAHRKEQNVLKMANRNVYQDGNLVFAKQVEDLQSPTAQLGQPCPALAERSFNQVIATAGVKLITPHGLRHSSATLDLGEGVSPKVVAEKLGHANASMTLNIYAHATEGLQREAAKQRGAVLAGR